MVVPAGSSSPAWPFGAVMKSLMVKAFDGTRAFHSWSSCMICALFCRCHPLPRRNAASAVYQAPLVRSPLSSGSVRSPTGVGTRRSRPSFVFMEP